MMFTVAAAVPREIVAPGKPLKIRTLSAVVSEDAEKNDTDDKEEDDEDRTQEWDEVDGNADGGCIGLQRHDLDSSLLRRA